MSLDMRLAPRMIQSMEILQLPLMALQERIDMGAKVIRASGPVANLPGAFVKPAIIDVTGVDVPDEEDMSMGCNILAVAPRQLIAVAGNPVTHSLLRTAGCTVHEFDGSELCIPGAGGPTCLTRPVLRAR